MTYKQNVSLVNWVSKKTLLIFIINGLTISDILSLKTLNGVHTICQQLSVMLL